MLFNERYNKFHYIKQKLLVKKHFQKQLSTFKKQNTNIRNYIY